MVSLDAASRAPFIDVNLRGNKKNGVTYNWRTAERRKSLCTFEIGFDARVHVDSASVLRISTISTNLVSELHIAGGSRFVLYYITIFADLFLIIGIEDVSRTVCCSTLMFRNSLVCSFCFR